MATNIPPHNITEVINGCTAYIDDEEISIEGLMEHILGPTSRRRPSSTVVVVLKKRTAPVAARFTSVPAPKWEADAKNRPVKPSLFTRSCIR